MTLYLGFFNPNYTIHKNSKRLIQLQIIQSLIPVEWSGLATKKIAKSCSISDTPQAEEI